MGPDGPRAPSVRGICRWAANADHFRGVSSAGGGRRAGTGWRVDSDGREDGFTRIRLAALGNTVKFATLIKIPHEGFSERRIKARFNTSRSRIVVATGSLSPWDAIRLQTFHTSTRRLLKTVTLRTVGSLEEMSVGARGVLYLHSPVAIANAADRRIRIVPRGKNGPRATSTRACGKAGIDSPAWLDSTTLLISCEGYRWQRYLVDLSGATAKRTAVYDDFHVEEPYTWIAGSG
jgi:hypothetical protein